MLSSEFRKKQGEYLDRCDAGEVIRFKRGDSEYMVMKDSGKDVLPEVGVFPSSAAREEKAPKTEVIEQGLLSGEEALAKVVSGPIVDVEKFLEKAKEKKSVFRCGCERKPGELMCAKCQSS